MIDQYEIQVGDTYLFAVHLDKPEDHGWPLPTWVRVTQTKSDPYIRVVDILTGKSYLAMPRELYGPNELAGLRHAGLRPPCRHRVVLCDACQETIVTQIQEEA